MAAVDGRAPVRAEILAQPQLCRVGLIVPRDATAEVGLEAGFVDLVLPHTAPAVERKRQEVVEGDRHQVTVIVTSAAFVTA